MPSPTDVLRASAEHDTETLRTLLSTFSPNLQEPETLNTPLHAAVLSFESACKTSDAQEVEKARSTISILFENGAIWNPLNKNNETPGCIALRLGLTNIYEEMVRAGVRAEMLFNRLDAGLWERVSDEEDAADEINEEDLSVDTKEQNILKNVMDHNASVTSASYLSGKVDFDDDKLLSENGNAVMMKWESDIMRKSADSLLKDVAEGSRSVLNIGFGMGIIDSYFQDLSPDLHYIVEAHEEVLAKMKHNGWLDKKNVVVLQGKWQDVLPQLMAERPELTFSAIYYDTFGETYSDLKEFFSEFVVNLLTPESGRFGFFHGLGADRQICYDVYTKVVEIDLCEAGLDVHWEDIPVPRLGDEGRGVWEEVTRRYWVLENYRLPLCSFAD